MPDAVSVDTGYYVYAVVPAQSALPADLRGLDGAAVQLLRYGDLAAAVTPIALDRPPGRRAELVAHSEVVDHLAAAVAVVPAQFGSVMADRESVLRELLERDHDRLLRVLRRLEGCCQLNLRATYVEDQVLAEVLRERPDVAELHRRTRHLPPGTLHPDLVQLGELVARVMEDKRAIDAPEVLAVVEGHIRARAPRPGGGVDHLLDVAMLLDRDEVSALEADLEQLAEGVHERIRLRLTGPTAPYDFVEEETWA